jgi:hypothetical protein
LQRALRHARLWWRAERVIAETRLRLALRRTVLYALAGLIAAIGLGMLDVAFFLLLRGYWGPVWAAFAVALGDFVIAGVVALIALMAPPGAAMTSAVELRDAAAEGLEAELAPLQERLGFFSRVAREPLDTMLPAMLIPLITAIVRSLRRDNAAR